jgi:two-component system, OmpR family, catabolic regulation response regulator CreB
MPNLSPPLSTILLIEDEAAIADTIIYALQSEGFSVAWKQLGKEGISLLETTNCALVILDVGLPDQSGFEVCKQIRQFSEVPIIFLTARNEEIDRVVGLEIGADDYVGKPFSPRELTARVKTILKRTMNAGTLNQHPQPDFIIDNNRNSIHFQQQLLALTRYEYLILKVLLKQPEHVFSRGKIMDLVWDHPEASFDRAVDTHIKTLRAKLKQIAGYDPIKTHRGFGYSIQASCDEL